MISVKTSTCKIWKNSISAISTLIEEAAFRFTPDGIRLKAMDPTHISLIELHFPTRTFEEYKVKEEKTIGLSVSRLEEFLSRVKGDEEMKLELDEEANQLILVFKKNVSRKFTVPLIEVSESELPDTKKLESGLTSSAEVLAGSLIEGLKDAKLISDCVKFELNSRGLTLSAKGEKGTTETYLEKGSGSIEIKGEIPPATANFAIEYLLNILKAVEDEDWIRIKMGNDMPIMLEMNLDGDRGTLIFVLAPRMEL